MPLLLSAMLLAGTLVAFFAFPSFAHDKAGRRELVSYVAWRVALVLGLALGAARGLWAAVAMGFGGVGLCFFTEWLLEDLKERPFASRPPRGSLLLRLWLTRLPHGLGLSVAGVGVALFLHDLASSYAQLSASLVFVGLALVALSFRRAAALTRELSGLAGAAVETVAFDEALCAKQALRQIEIGIGDEVSVVRRRGKAPYREEELFEQLIRGSIQQGSALAMRATLARVPAMAAVALALGAMLSTPRRHPFAPPRSAQPSAPASAAPASHPSSTVHRTGLSWYPQPAPIVEDLNGDGVEDVIGLRWDADKPGAALHVVANDGKTMNELWRSEGYPAQWYGPSTHLLRHGDALFMTDGEGNVHVFAPATGAVRTFADVPLPRFVCGTRGDPRVFLQTSDSYRQGWLIGPEGRREAGKRPGRCHLPGQVPSCVDDRSGVCVSNAAPPFLAVERERGSIALLEEGETGVGIRDGGEARPDKATAWGYDVSTKKRRYEAPLVFDRDVLHATPRFESKVSAGRIFIYYQQRSGSWRLGARDAATGEVLWKTEPPRAALGTSFSNMHATRDRLYVALDRRLEVFDAATGASIGVVW